MQVAKHGWEFGFVDDTCYRRAMTSMSDDECSSACDEEDGLGVSQFSYIGGSYGKSNELQIMREIRARGPVPVGILTPNSIDDTQGKVI